jgi:ATP-binding cassette, subfamily B, bacterial
MGLITIGSLVMYFGAFQQGQSYLLNMLKSLAGLYEDNLFLSKLYEFLDLEPRIKEPEKPHKIPRPIKSGLALEAISFQYPGQDHQALQDISLFIEPGQTVALVGENGSSKTTLIKLLCRVLRSSRRQDSNRQHRPVLLKPDFVAQGDQRHPPGLLSTIS